MMAATLRQLGFATELVFGNLDWHLTEVQLLRGVHVAFALRYLTKAKVGLVGYHAPGKEKVQAKQKHLIGRAMHFSNRIPAVLYLVKVGRTVVSFV